MSDLEAIAAMPGLEDLAATIEPFCGRTADPISMVIYIAAQWPAGGRDTLTSMLKWSLPVWENARASAARVGRILPERPPNHDDLRHIRNNAALAGVQLGQDTADAFSWAMRSLVRDVGFMNENVERRTADPSRLNTLYGDGSVFKAFTDNFVHPITGELHGKTRSKRGQPRVAETFAGKNITKSLRKGKVSAWDEEPEDIEPDLKDPSKGLPIALLGAHGGLPHQRVVTAMSMYFDRNETGAAMALFDRVVDIYGDGLHGFSYDRLMGGTKVRDIMRAGVTPLIEMRGAGNDDPHFVQVPDDLRYKLGDKSKPKLRAVARELETATHCGGSCQHVIWALDGQLRWCYPDEHRPSFASPVLRQRDLRFEDNGRGAKQMIGIYDLECPNGIIEFVFDHSSSRRGKGKDCAIADWVRPIHIALDARHLRGYRVDVESTFRTAKGALPLFGRASSLHPDDFLLDAVGFGLWTNAVAWDVHAAQHTQVGRVLAAANLRRVNRKTNAKTDDPSS